MNNLHIFKNSFHKQSKWILVRSVELLGYLIFWCLLYTQDPTMKFKVSMRHLQWWFHWKEMLDMLKVEDYCCFVDPWHPSLDVQKIVGIEQGLKGGRYTREKKHFEVLPQINPVLRAPFTTAKQQQHSITMGTTHSQPPLSIAFIQYFSAVALVQFYVVVYLAWGLNFITLYIRVKFLIRSRSAIHLKFFLKTKQPVHIRETSTIRQFCSPRFAALFFNLCQDQGDRWAADGRMFCNHRVKEGT